MLTAGLSMKTYCSLEPLKDSQTKRYPKLSMKINFSNNPSRLMLFLRYFTNYTSFIEKFIQLLSEHIKQKNFILFYNRSNSCFNRIIIIGKKKETFIWPLSFNVPTENDDCFMNLESNIY